MTGRAGSRTPQAPRSGARGNRFCRALMKNLRAQARSSCSAKLGGPRILGPVRHGMVRSKSARDGSLETRRGLDVPWGCQRLQCSETVRTQIAAVVTRHRRWDDRIDDIFRPVAAFPLGRGPRINDASKRRRVKKAKRRAWIARPPLRLQDWSESCRGLQLFGVGPNSRDGQ
jgi:hypothetical protein